MGVYYYQDWLGWGWFSGDGEVLHYQANEGWGQLREALVLQLTVQHMVFVGSCGNTGNGISTDPQVQQYHGPRHGHE